MKTGGDMVLVIQYTDDIMAFVDANIQILENLKYLLVWFEEACVCK